MRQTYAGPLVWGGCLAAVGLTSTLAMVRAADIQAVQDGSVAKITVDGRPVLEYRAAQAPFKPYVSQLYTPTGVPLLRDSPADHKHHHGLMLGLGVDRVDFWSETKDCGRQVSRQFTVNTSTSPGYSSAVIIQDLDWLAPGDRLLLREQRAIRAQSGDGASGTFISWHSRLACPPGKDVAELWGRHYFGFGARFVESMDKIGKIISPEGKLGQVVRGDEHLTAANWLAYTAPVDGKPVTVAVFDDPRNVRHPNRIFSMTQPFAYLSITLNLEKEPLVIAAGKPLDLRWGAAVWDGEARPAKIAEFYERWAAAVSGG